VSFLTREFYKIKKNKSGRRPIPLSTASRTGLTQSVPYERSVVNELKNQEAGTGPVAKEFAGSMVGFQWFLTIFLTTCPLFFLSQIKPCACSKQDRRARYTWNTISSR